MGILSQADVGLEVVILNSHAIWRAAAAILLFSVIQYYWRRTPMPDLPVVGQAGQEFGVKEVVECHEKYPDTPVLLPLPYPLVLLPMKIFDEVRNLPEDKLSFNKDVQRMFMSQHTKIGNDRPESVKAVKIDLTRNIASTTDGLQDEIKYSLDTEFGDCKEWSSIPIYPKMLRIIALLSGRVFVGRPLSRQEEWIQSTINYTIDAVAAREAMVAYPSILKGLVAPFLPEIKRVKSHISVATKLLEPIMESVLAKEKTSNEESEDAQGTCVSWIMKQTPPEQGLDPAVLAECQMILSFAAIHTTTMAVCHVLYDLIARPEYTEILRKEINEVIAEDGQDLDGDGFMKLKKQSMSKLRKLDSFIKESQRLSPPQLITNFRLITSDLTLSTGHTLPKGTRVAVPAHAVHMSSSTKIFSSASHPDNKPVSEFDGLRFYRLRQMAGQENRHQFVSTALDSLNFGHGNHACPGRFFASNEIKIIMIELLRNWDLRMKGDVQMKGSVELRPKNYVNDMTVAPSTNVEIEFRRKNQPQ